MKKNPFISVIIVAYNYERYLPRCLNAVIAQKFEDYEIVIVDNGSTDGSAKIIHNYIEMNKEIDFNFIKIDKNIGLPNGRNKGIEAARGEYILFNDADDWMSDDCLLELAQKAKSTNADKVAGFYSEVDVNGNVLRVCEYPKQFSNWLSSSLQGVMFKREYFDKYNIRVPLDTRMDDIFINLTFHCYAEYTEYVKKSIFNYFVNPYSTSGAKNNNKNWNSTVLIQDCFSIFMPLYNNLVGFDKVMLEYVLIKQYYFFFLHNNRYVDKETAIYNFESANKIIIDNCPNYLKNRNICLLKSNGDRRSGQLIVWTLNKIERLHLMKLFISLYLFLSKRYYLVPSLHK